MDDRVAAGDDGQQTDKDTFGSRAVSECVESYAEQVPHAGVGTEGYTEDPDPSAGIVVDRIRTQQTHTQVAHKIKHSIT